MNCPPVPPTAPPVPLEPADPTPPAPPAEKADPSLTSPEQPVTATISKTHAASCHRAPPETPHPMALTVSHAVPQLANQRADTWLILLRSDALA